MAVTELDGLLRNTDNVGFKLVPHVEEFALKYIFRNYIMAARVATFTDMNGWNVRKISEYLPSRRAKELSEDTAIPDTPMLRARKSDVEPKEIGDRYRVTNRRATTDLESILADTVQALGKGLGDKVEIDLIQKALAVFRGGTLGNGTAEFSFDSLLGAATLFRQRVHTGQVYAAIHPFQALPIMQDLIDYVGAQTNLTYRDQAATRLQNVNLREFDLPTFGNVNLTIGEFVPRRVIFKFKLYGTGGTFRLQVGDDYVVGTNITAAITASATAATLIANIETALNALTMTSYYSGSGSWDVTGTDILDITITPPTDMFLTDGDQLRFAVKADEDATLSGGFIEANLQKSSYDLVTGLTGAPLDVAGASLGVTMEERSATAKAMVWQRDALIFDIRQSVQSFFETVYQGRTAEYSAHMVYGVDAWSPERGMFIHAKANSPLATG